MMKYYENRDQPIVAGITFNSGMDVFHISSQGNEIDTLGLRIIYGAVKSMGLLERTECCEWNLFLSKFENYSELSLSNAISLLRRVFGGNRPFLLLVDEISKAKNDFKVISEISTLLNGDANFDAIVSALSPGYVKSLVTGSQRPIMYVILPPLIDEKLGMKESLLFAKKIYREALEQGVPSEDIDPFRLRIVENAYLLTSGHPRSVEKMVTAFQSENNNKLISFLSPKEDMFDLFVGLMVEWGTALTINNTDKDNMMAIFRTPSICSVNDANFRRLLESGNIMIKSSDTFGREYSVTTTFSNILDLSKFDKSSICVPYGDSIGDFCGCLKTFKSSKISVWWENAIALTICLRSQNLKEISLIKNQKIFPKHPFKLKVARDEDFDNFYQEELLIPDDFPQKGFDFRVSFAHAFTNYTFYGQVKIALTPKRTFEELVKKSVIASVIDHFQRTSTASLKNRLDNLQFVFYIWESSNVLKSSNISKITINDSDVNERFEDLDFDMNSNQILRSDVQKYFQEISLTDRIHVMCQQDLEKWLTPSFLIIPMMVKNLRDDTSA
jgi:hypothetical protein